MVSRFTKFGVPFFILVIGGSFGLKHFTSIRYEYKNSKKLLKEVADKEGIQMKPANAVTLDTEFEKIKEIDTSNWENKRGPRPWEEDNELYKEAVERGKKLEEQKKKISGSLSVLS